MSQQSIFELQDVFVLSGIPRHTFVQPVEYTRLLVALRTPGRSIVVEGASGIGKTTAVVNAILEAGIFERVPSRLHKQTNRDRHGTRALTTQH